jgi:hypothetical protein
MPTSEKKIAANRLNGRKSRGPKNTTSTRFNATKHGLLALGITELDDAEGYRNTLSGLEKEFNPVGLIEMFLVESAAVEMVRLRRARRLEAEYITEVLNPPIESGPMCELPSLFHVDPGLPALMKLPSVQALVSVHQRYESPIVHRLFRTLHELERLQRIRRGERVPVPAPAPLDVSVHHETGMQSGTTPLPQQKTLGDEDDAAIESAGRPLPQREGLGERQDEDSHSLETVKESGALPVQRRTRGN